VARNGTVWRKLAGRKGTAILALLTARSIEDAARNTNAPLRTLHRWLKEPEFDVPERKSGGRD